MGKNRPLPRSAYVRGPTLGADGRMAGSWIRPRSVDHTALNVRSLSAIVGVLGTVYNGTMYAGTSSGLSAPRVIIGEEANGLQMYDQNGILCASISWRNGSGRLGRLGSPGITWANGSMYIDGDAIIDGTVRTSKLEVGDPAFTFLEEGRLVVGYGYLPGMAPDDTASQFTGFVAQTSGIGGLNKGSWTWYVDQYTGAIVSAGPRGWPIDGVKIADGQIELAALFSGDYDRPTMIFTTYGQMESGEIGPSASAWLQGVGPGLMLSSPEAEATFQVRDDSQYSYATLGPWYLDIHVNSSDGSQLRGIQLSENGLIAGYGSAGASFTIKHISSNSGISFTNAQPEVVGAPLKFYHGSAAETYAEGSIEWDAATHTPRVWDGTAWQTLAFVS